MFFKMFKSVCSFAQNEGFSLLYALPTTPLKGWNPTAEGVGEGLSPCPGDMHPQATSILFLVYPYRPFRIEERIPAYYLASNAAYFACNRVMDYIKEKGFYAERAKTPLRVLAKNHGIGSISKCGLMRIPPYGSCIVLEQIATDICTPQPFDPPIDQPCPEGCTACMDECPTGAISKDGLDVKRCMRLSMETAMHPDFVKEKQKHFIGCESCLRSCPFNIAQGYAEPTEEQKAAFDLAGLIAGNTSAARKLTGKNMTGGGRLTAEAIAFAAKLNINEKLFPLAQSSPFEAVQDALRWAKERKPKKY